MSYSLITKKRLEEFNKKNYKKLLNYISYFGNPHNGRPEFYANEEQIRKWIAKKIYWRYDGKLQRGIIAIDHLTIQWDITFHYNSNICWFIGRVQISPSIIILKSRKFFIKLYYGENYNEDEIFESKFIKFIGPTPEFKSVIFKEGVTEFLHIKWDNSHITEYQKEENPEIINVEKFKMEVGDVAVIYASLKNDF